MSLSGSILLVGEGNFSFSASLSRLHSETATSITATCFQSEEEALRHEGAGDNIRIINNSGGAVLFGVDCTQLGECTSLQGRMFDRVVFNFPHCGRKSGVKKNRELLKKFFLSCVQVLAEDGEIHVSLCNGQGGTPADHPKREWHNSWQVAAMAAEAHLVLTDVCPFETEKYQSYRCTGYRSQDKGFHVEKALLHVFTRSFPYTSARVLTVEETVEGQNVQYNMPAELSDYMFRGFLCTDSVHPVRLVQEFLLKGLKEKWSVCMSKETVPILLTAKQLQKCCHEVNTTHCYWIHLVQKELSCKAQTSTDRAKNPLMPLHSRGCCDKQDVTSDKVDGVRSKQAPGAASKREKGIYVLRPSLLPQMEELLSKREVVINCAGNDGENEGENNVDVEGPNGVYNGDPELFGISDLVFRNVPINLWALPSFHELVFRGSFPSESKAVTLLGQRLETLLAPYGVSLVAEQGGLCLTAQPMGVVGRVFGSSASDSLIHVNITVSLNLDLLAVLLFSLPDWRLLWSHDPRFLKQFALHPSPGKAFQPLSLFPERMSFDISFWTGSTWEEREFHAVVREASHGTVEEIKLIDKFSHPDLSQTSYCYRLTYNSHTHALSHTQALQFHKSLESLLSSRLEVAIR